MVTRKFSTTEISRITGIPYDTLYGWMHSGLVTPSLVKPQGRGKRARWDFWDLVAITTVQRLRQHGVRLQGLIRVVRALQRHLEMELPLPECWLVTDGDTVAYLLASTQLLSLLRTPGECRVLYLVDMKRLTDDLRAQVG